MKKLTLLILMLLFPGMALAAWDVGWTPNWLVGISAGYGERLGQVLVNNTYNGIVIDNRIPVTVPMGAESEGLLDTGFIWGILVGYQAICHQWLWGIELSADRQSISRQHQFEFEDPLDVTWQGDFRYQRKMTAGLTTRIGYALRTNFMPYLRGGVEIGEDRLKTFYFNPLILNGQPAFNEQSTWVWRFLLGAGVEFPLFPPCGVTLRAEYDYHSKGKTLYTNAALFSDGVSILFQSQSQPWTNTYRLTLVKNFF